jgi:hypothetical protein
LLGDGYEYFNGDIVTQVEDLSVFSSNTYDIIVIKNKQLLNMAKSLFEHGQFIDYENYL